jgi:hypothetical protein
VDHEAAKKLAERFVRFSETGVADGLFAEDVFCDINVPEWRFQMQGADAAQRWLRDELPDGCSIPSWRSDPTASGVVVEIEQHIGDEISRNLHRLEVRDDKVVEWTMYCTGVWSLQTQERQRQQAPMIRP